MQWILDTEHKVKTAEEAIMRARARSLAARHAGLERPGKVKIPHRKREREPYQPPDGKTAIQRRFGA